MDTEGNYDYCPIFDNGAGLLSDIKMDYPLGNDVYELTENVKAKTICSDFDVQLTVSEQLYGENLKFNFTKNDVEEVIGNAGGYSREEKERVRDIIFNQMRKYGYIFH